MTLSPKGRVLGLVAAGLVAAVSGTAAGDEGVIQLHIESGQEALGATICGYGMGLSLTTGMSVEVRDEDAGWRAVVTLAGEQLQVGLWAPGGEPVAAKSVMVTDDPCAEAIQILAILISAYAPEIARASRRPAKSSAAPPAPLEPPSMTAAPRNWRVGGVLGAVTGGSNRGWRGGLRLATGRGAAAAALGLFGQYESPRLGAGSIQVTSLDLRLSAGAEVGLDALLTLRASALAGARYVSARARGFATNDVAALWVAEAGLEAEAVVPLGESWSVGLGAALLAVRPRPRLTVRGLDGAYTVDNPAVEVFGIIAWSAGP